MTQFHPNFSARVRYILEVYNRYKQEDVPDTRIVRNIFPRYGIYISYRQWMNIKSLKPSQYDKSRVQLSLF